MGSAGRAAKLNSLNSEVASRDFTVLSDFLKGVLMQLTRSFLW